MSASKVTKSDFPKDFVPKDGDLLAADNTARQTAQAAWTATFSLDILSTLLSVASATSIQDEEFDSRLVLHLASKAVSGIAALLAPHTQQLVEDAISKRLALRTNAIPPKFKTLIPKFLASDPLSQKPCGAGELFQGIVNEAPQPLQVNLPPQFYQAVFRSQNNYGSSAKGSNNYKGVGNAKGKGQFSKGNFFHIFSSS